MGRNLISDDASIRKLQDLAVEAAPFGTARGDVVEFAYTKNTPHGKLTVSSKLAGIGDHTRWALTAILVKPNKTKVTVKIGTGAQTDTENAADISKIMEALKAVIASRNDEDRREMLSLRSESNEGGLGSH